MIFAWHLISEHKKDPETSYMTGRTTFHDIVRRGFLYPHDQLRIKKLDAIETYETPRQRRKRLETRGLWTSITRRPEKGYRYEENVLMKPLDVVAGDDKYVFLGLVPWHRGEALFPEVYDRSEELWSAYGFGFEAPQLIRNGAVVGITDLLQMYEKKINRVAEAIFTDYLTKKWGDEVSAELKAASFVRDTRYDELVQYIGAYGGMPFLQREFKKDQEEHRLSGEAALRYILAVWWRCYKAMEEDPTNIHNKHCGISSPISQAEILFPGPIPLEWAKYYIYDGAVLTPSEFAQMDL